MYRKNGIFAYAAAFPFLLVSTVLHATQPPASGTSFPSAYLQRIENDPKAFTYRRALQDVAARAAIARTTIQQANLGVPAEESKFNEQLAKVLGAAPGELPPTRVSGIRNIPVFTALFRDSVKPPYPARNLQTQLFEGPWPSGTMTDYYREVSGNALIVRGQVYDWATLPGDGSVYKGEDYIDPNENKLVHCLGLCETSKVADMIKQLLSKYKNIDWGQYDNDGPDGIPNSGDDDGYVDFIAIAQPQYGGECGNNKNISDNDAIWSHRYSLTGWGRTEFRTTTKKHGGGFISVDDYVIVPALDCGASTMTPIGVFSHEFGHAFGLPDLYDTDNSDGKSAGLGNWCLMASGSWGADGKNPQRPTHMSPWAKEFLGWVTYKSIDADVSNLRLDPIELSRTAYKIPISGSQYYVVNGIGATGFNNQLISGVQIWKVNDTVVKAGLKNNRVNAMNGNPGVMLVEASGENRLDNDAYRGGPDDIYPGAKKNVKFDVDSKPSSLTKFALCDIKEKSNYYYASFLVSANRCMPAQSIAAADINNDGMAGPLIIVPVSEKPAPSAVQAANSAPDGKEIEIKGTLTNAGANYFDRKTRKIIIKDKSGNEMEVAISATPLETAAPSPSTASSNSNAAAPRSLSYFLDKEVVIKGVVDRKSGVPVLRSQEISVSKP